MNPISFGPDSNLLPGLSARYLSQKRRSDASILYPRPRARTHTYNGMPRGAASELPSQPIPSHFGCRIVSRLFESTWAAIKEEQLPQPPRKRRRRARQVPQLEREELEAKAEASIKECTGVCEIEFLKANEASGLLNITHNEENKNLKKYLDATWNVSSVKRSKILKLFDLLEKM